MNAPFRSPAGDGHVDVRVQAIAVSDDDGSRRARVDPSSFARWVAFANRSFAEAGVRFAFDPVRDWRELRHRGLNDTLGAKDAAWPSTRRVGDRVAADHEGKLVVVVRHGPGSRGTGFGFAGTDLDFVVVGGFEDSRHCGHAHVDLLAHEIGHYLGLPHTFVGEPYANVGEAEQAFLESGRDPAVFDGDGFEDTPPDPAVRTLECERRAELTLAGHTFVLPRRNLMSYYDERASLSPQQIERARWVLDRRRRHGMALPKNRPGSRAWAAEALRVLDVADGDARIQDMRGFGADGWSRGRQMFCGTGACGRVTLALLDLPPARYRVVCWATLAPDYGKIRCLLDDEPFGSTLDLHAPIVLPSGALEVGSVALAPGVHRLTFEVAGRHPESTGFRFGIDAIEFLR